jgi:hypothetical protein
MNATRTAVGRIVRGDQGAGLLHGWGLRVARQVGRKVADAKAHAALAVTDALRREPDGRATIRKADQSPSFRAALARLDELLEGLCGPSRASRRGILRAAREDFYRASWKLYRPETPIGVRVDRRDPAEADLVAARTLVLHGMDLRDELKGEFDSAARSLRATVVKAGRRDAPARAAEDLLDAWERTARLAIERRCNLALGDALVAITAMAARDLVRPEALSAAGLVA